ncbi:hypothetical protein RMSM_02821 [Rhodopirellula maiorica SM1]|uniref:Uncharacterized protein n=1 Tax=Rhodopirellula maiorica SM1 TaxID=1265738 RepID=M5RLQ4_9BACT|nr:hypothetical protein RMSM_02821 [Rhodopirellula maiorica SM1]
MRVEEAGLRLVSDPSQRPGEAYALPDGTGEFGVTTTEGSAAEPPLGYVVTG